MWGRPWKRVSPLSVQCCQVSPLTGSMLYSLSWTRTPLVCCSCTHHQLPPIPGTDKLQIPGRVNTKTCHTVTGSSSTEIKLPGLFSYTTFLGEHRSHYAKPNSFGLIRNVHDRCVQSTSKNYTCWLSISGVMVLTQRCPHLQHINTWNSHNWPLASPCMTRFIGQWPIQLHQDI
jgi:hypothetical protein